MEGAGGAIARVYMHVQLMLLPISKGSKNVFHKNKSRCRDGAKCLQRTHVPAWKNQLAEKLHEQGGVPFHAQQSRLTFSGIKDTLDTCSPSLHLATSVVVYMHML